MGLCRGEWRISILCCNCTGTPGEETAEDKPCVSTDKLLYVLDSGKRLCRVSGDLSVTQLLGIVYHVVATALLAVGQLTAALVPVAQYIILLLIHGVECFLWVSKEPKLNVKFFKVGCCDRVLSTCISDKYFPCTLICKYT